MLLKDCIQNIRKGDVFYVNGRRLIAEHDAHQNFDEPDEPWIVYDIGGNSWFEEDIEINKNNRYEFTKQGIADMISSLNIEWGAIWESLGDGGREHVEISIDGRIIYVPICADNCNAIIYMLKEIFWSESTGETTMGNLQKYCDKLDKKYEKIKEV